MSLSIVLINQSVPIGVLESLCRTHRQAWALVTTHELFPTEVQQLSKLSRPPQSVIRDRDLLDENDFVEIDKLVCSEFRASGRPFAYPDEINEAILIHRAAVLKRRIASHFKDSSLDYFHADGLGIPSAWWRLQGSEPIQAARIAAPTKHSRFRELRDRIRHSKGWSHLAFSSGARLILAGRTQRITSRIPQDTKIRKASLGERLRFLSSRFSPTVGPHSTLVASPVHDYWPLLGRPTLILQDGHLPRDYSLSRFFLYPKSDAIVPSNPFTEEWIRRGGLVPKRIPGFSDPDFSLPNKAGPRAKNVLLTLQHGGDWSPFVYRSDTDRMLLEFIRLAAETTTLNFKVRPHPTMVHPAHDGPGSLDRIRREIENASLPNLTISNRGLAEDMAWADVVISEYSQVLLEAWRSGQLGIVYNPTGRRSFMQEFEELGFPWAGSRQDIVRLVQSAQKLSEQQRAACVAYNMVMSRWRNDC